MLPLERQNKIVDIISAKHSASVEELAHSLDVSAMTVRRDLDKLERMGLILRTHGGAVQAHVHSNEIGYEQKNTHNHNEKETLANIALSLIKEGDSIYLDAGTTTFKLASLIAKTFSNLTVVTNDLNIATCLVQTKLNIIMCGGNVQNVTGSTIGPLTQDFLRNIKVNISFVAASSISEDFNIMTPTLDKVYLKREAVGVGSRSYLIADKDKFYSQALFKVVHLSAFTGIITDKIFTEAEQKQLQALEIEII